MVANNVEALEALEPQEPCEHEDPKSSMASSLCYDSMEARRIVEEMEEMIDERDQVIGELQEALENALNMGGVLASQLKFLELKLEALEAKAA